MPTQDIFQRNVSELGGVFTSDRAKLEFGEPGMGVLVQRMQFTYAQTITRLYEVGANGTNGESAIYYVGGRTMGNMAIDRVIGPSNTTRAFYAKYGDVCGSRGRNISLQLKEVDCSATSGTQAGSAALSGAQQYLLKNCVITQVSIGVTSQEMIIGENTTLMYSSLEIPG